MRIWEEYVKNELLDLGSHDLFFILVVFVLFSYFISFIFWVFRFTQNLWKLEPLTILDLTLNFKKFSLKYEGTIQITLKDKILLRLAKPIQKLREPDSKMDSNVSNSMKNWLRYGKTSQNKED